ncbi:hypothetical protein [Microscilla marina]|uniref:Uncharacterized protein n=1 Tax=Microscilla marina ATCC 23134 TaxID=313606 RepID=A1ZW76_MICM2|nr:hypothetical protein [Microscilla marina]EAY25314.1 hypothetical protein M23134_04494 [Microscilla marina ATCC 23134]
MKSQVYFPSVPFDTEKGEIYWQNNIKGYEDEILMRSSLPFYLSLYLDDKEVMIEDNVNHTIESFCLQGLLDLYHHQNSISNYYESDCYIRMTIEDEFIYISGNDLWNESDDDELVEAYVEKALFMKDLYICATSYLTYLKEILDYFKRESNTNKQTILNLTDMVWRVEKLLTEVVHAKIPALNILTK